VMASLSSTQVRQSVRLVVRIVRSASDETRATIADLSTTSKNLRKFSYLSRPTPRGRILLYRTIIPWPENLRDTGAQDGRRVSNSGVKNTCQVRYGGIWVPITSSYPGALTGFSYGRAVEMSLNDEENADRLQTTETTPLLRNTVVPPDTGTSSIGVPAIQLC
jgi:hypothetical protein